MNGLHLSYLKHVIKGFAAGNYYGGMLAFTLLFLFPGLSQPWHAFLFLGNVVIGKLVLMDITKHISKGN